MVWTVTSLVMIISTFFAPSWDAKCVMLITSALFAIAGAIGFAGTKIGNLADKFGKKE